MMIGMAVEILGVVLLLDMLRRVHGARANFYHAHAYEAWMVFLGCSIATLSMEAMNAGAREAHGILESLAIGFRLTAVTSLWVALFLAMPGSLSRQVLERSRFGVKGPAQITKLQTQAAPGPNDENADNGAA